MGATAARRPAAAKNVVAHCRRIGHEAAQLVVDLVFFSFLFFSLFSFVFFFSVGDTKPRAGWRR